MARLLTDGALLGSTTSYSTYGNYPGIFYISGATVTSSNPRTGGFAFLCSASTDGLVLEGLGSLDVTYSARCYMRFSTATPSAQFNLIYPWVGTTNFTFGVKMETNGTLTLRDEAGTTLGTSAALAANTYYCIEFQWKVPTGGGSTSGTLGLWVDNSLVAFSSACNTGSTAKTELDMGRATDPGTDPAITIDDIAINNSSGSNQTGRVGPGRALLSVPTSDNALGTGWEAPQTTGSDVTGIFAAIDNIPPAGSAHSDSDANNLKYIFNAASNASTNADFNAQSYDTIGVLSSERVSLVVPFCNTGSSSATDTSGAVRVTSNPADAGDNTFVFDNGVAGTYPTNWHTNVGLPVYNPSITRGSSPVLRVGKRTATTRVAMVDFLGLIVEAVPTSLAYDTRRIRANSLLRR